ncbi:MAG: DeoR/GlpR family DNA-binding transcription regulator [Chloroflexi bacterium]|nr:DeoR/GlpR family DNA-binding transcription regulator [Chloroflexota bacterium]
MIREKRHSRIIEIIRQEHLVTVRDLSQEFGVSYMTILRDLEELETRGRLQRIRGGAVAIKDDVESLPPPQSRLYDPALDPQRHKKLAIGRYAATHLVEDGDNITIEAGSTASNMAPFLSQSGLTILTNGLLTSMMLAPAVGNLTLICSGGILIDTWAFTGPQAEDFFSKFRVKKAFFGAQGLTLRDGFTDPTPLYTRLKSVMKQNTDRVIMLVDSTKFGIRSLVQVMPLEDVDVIVTDPGAPQEMIAALRERGMDVRVVEEGTPSP